MFREILLSGGGVRCQLRIVRTRIGLPLTSGYTSPGRAHEPIRLAIERASSTWALKQRQHPGDVHAPSSLDPSSTSPTGLIRWAMAKTITSWNDQPASP